MSKHEPEQNYVPVTKHPTVYAKCLLFYRSGAIPDRARNPHGVMSVKPPILCIQKHRKLRSKSALALFDPSRWSRDTQKEMAELLSCLAILP